MKTDSPSKPPANPATERDGVDVRCLVQHLDLFSGIGGFALAAQWVGGIETIGFCEIDPWAQKVLNKNFPGVPIHADVKTLDPNDYGRIDLITAGYPCQPFSVAGKQRGAEDDRHLWPEVFRIIKEARPRWVLCENVAGHIVMGLDQVLSDLEGERYTAEAIVIPACAVDAAHRRDRVWILAHPVVCADCSEQGSEAEKSGIQSRVREEGCSGVSTGAGNALHSDDGSERGEGGLQEQIPQFQGLQRGEDGRRIAIFRGRPDLSTPALCRSSDGIPKRLDRTKGLGNAIVPQVAAEILRAMMTTDSLLNAQANPPTAGE